MNMLLRWQMESQLSFPADTVLLLDEDEHSGHGKGLNDGVFDPLDVVDTLTNRHNGGGNVTWADGHAGYLHPSKLVRDRADFPPRMFIPFRAWQ
jgi:prepilin-type processing-associated H-X9-DG protein